MKFSQRSSVLGIDPKLILVFELGPTVDLDEFRKSDLLVVDSSDKRVVVAFAGDPELTAFHERVDAYSRGAPPDQQSEPYAQFFDAIDALRPFGSEDRVSADLRQRISDSPTDQLRLDIECWHPGEAAAAGEWLAEVKAGVEASGGSVADTMIHDGVGLLLLRVYMPASQIMELAKLDAIARIDLLPRPALSSPELFSLTVADLPEVQSPHPRSPIVGIVDSGIASGHHLIGPAVLASDAIGTGISDDQDEHGHGTMVASLLLYGDVQRVIVRSLPVRPLCRIVSARVLDAHNQFPADDLWEQDLAGAIRWCAMQGAKIVNLSIGDERSPFVAPRQMTAAAVVDDLARQLGIVAIVPTGNSRPADYMPTIDESATQSYPEILNGDGRSGLLDPGSSLLSLTVGGVTDAVASGGQSGRETLGRLPMGQPGWPSPITRRGPGPGDAIKPEVVEGAGTLGVEHGHLVSNDPELGVVGARAKAGGLLSWDVGTSFAVPLVSRVAAAIAARFPDFTAELIRALVLLSASRIEFADNFEGRRADRLKAERSLLGYGRPSIARAIGSSSHRAILVANDIVPINGVHIYEIPVPSTFMETGGERGIDISLAYSPPTRLRRLDYMASRMEFHLVKGLPVEEVVEVFAKVQGEDLADDSEEDGTRPPTPSQLGSHLVKLEPGTEARSRGANQLGRRTFRNRLDSERDSPMFLVVRNVNRWDDDGATQPYSLAVALWRDEQQAELHAELEAQLEAVVELPVEIEIEV